MFSAYLHWWDRHTWMLLLVIATLVVWLLISPRVLALILAWVRPRQVRINGPVPYDKAYAVLLARTIDILVAGWIWRDYDVTISALTGLALRDEAPPAWAILLGAFLELCQRNHCEQAIAADRERATASLSILVP